MDGNHLDMDGAGIEGLAELLHECGFEPQRAERMARTLFRISEPEFGEDD